MFLHSIVSPLTAPDPSHLPGLVAWLLTEAGWSAATTFLIAVAIWLWRKYKGSEMSDVAKRVLSAVFPFVIIFAAYSVQALAGWGESWSLEGLYEHFYAAFITLFGSQALYALLWKPVGDWFMGEAK